ncbi:virulence factor MviN [Paeniglutamicibacter antarcticus]|uniref:Virulence factor MviN n=1 Tax=Arthrobacter terrae TaxID=2935737 RepID=A0A931CRS3_9MICC|nr:lipid II flippase MurJ [Arthrobacter terrae]MBG0741797.1 virulence factor MviN [Arthrobacter terrae]
MSKSYQSQHQTRPASDVPLLGQVNVARSGAIMAIGTLVSRVLGLTKVALIAVAIGALGPLSSIFDAANNLPNLLYIMLAGGVFNVVLVPQIIKASRLPDRGSDYLSRVLTLGVILLLSITVVATLAAGPLMSIFTQFEGTQLVIATQFAVWLLPQICFYGLYALVGQILNAHNRFGAYMWAPVLNNIIAIIGILVFLQLWGPQTISADTLPNWTIEQTVFLGGMTTLGVVMQAMVLLVPLRRLGLGLRPRWGWRGMGLKATGKIAGWALGTMIIGQLSWIFITWVATGATGKSDSTSSDVPGLFLFNRATDIYILPHSIVVLSIATIYFNQMAKAATSGNQIALREAVSRLLRTVGVITFFGSSVLFLLAGQIGRLIGGASPEAGFSIGVAVAILALSSPFLSANFIFNRVLYATEDARTPFVLQLVLIVIGVVGAIAVLGVQQEYLIFALLGTISAGNIIAAFISGAVLHRKIGNFGMANIIKTHLKFAAGALSSILIGVPALIALGGASFIDGNFDGFAWQSPLNAFTTAVAVGLIMAVIYVLTLKILRAKEINDLLSPLLGRFSHHCAKSQKP